jgi:glycosyltransferase involved in cell wall biosynthesis
MRPLVSVIISLYNKEDYVTRAIESILAQTYKHYEIIVVDDGSTDASRAVLEPYMERITYIWQENAGPGAARNRGIRESSGQYLAFLDADDYWLEEYLENTVSFLERHLDVGAVATAYWRERAEGRLRWPPSNFGEHCGPIGDFFTIYAKTQFCWTGSVLLKRDILVRLGGFRAELKVGEDTELWCRVGAVSQWGYISKPLAVYDQKTPDSLTRGEGKISRTADLWDWEMTILPLLSHRQKRSYQYLRWMFLWGRLKTFLLYGDYQRLHAHARVYRNQFSVLRGIFLVLFAISPARFLRLLQWGYRLYLKQARKLAQVFDRISESQL